MEAYLGVSQKSLGGNVSKFQYKFCPKKFLWHASVKKISNASSKYVEIFPRINKGAQQTSKKKYRFSVIFWNCKVKNQIGWLTQDAGVAVGGSIGAVSVQQAQRIGGAAFVVLGVALDAAICELSEGNGAVRLSLGHAWLD